MEAQLNRGDASEERGLNKGGWFSRLGIMRKKPCKQKARMLS